MLLWRISALPTFYPNTQASCLIAKQININKQWWIASKPGVSLVKSNTRNVPTRPEFLKLQYFRCCVIVIDTRGKRTYTNTPGFTTIVMADRFRKVFFFHFSKLVLNPFMLLHVALLSKFKFWEYQTRPITTSKCKNGSRRQRITSLAPCWLKCLIKGELL